MKSNTKNLIDKFLRNELTHHEAEELKKWKDHPANKAFLKQEIQMYHLINAYCESFDAEKAYNNHMIRMGEPPRKKITFYRRPWFQYMSAAMIVGILLAGYFFKENIFKPSPNQTPIIVNNQIEPGIDKATLTLEDGTQVSLEKGTTYQTPNANSNGEEIVYKPTTSSQQPIANILTIPRGGQFQLTLSDGTKVWLNSETELKYPVSFIDGVSRQVELVYGEAYFEVSHSTAHKGSDFRVFHSQQEVQVLGTAFNIKAYKDEMNIYTTLAKGKVAVNYGGKTKFLTPGERSILDSNKNMLTVDKVDVKSQIAWREGVFDFEGMQLKEIMKVLSRWYDFDVVFENKSLETVKFKGILNKSQSIEEILSAIRSISLNNYEINNKTIILK